VLDLPTPSRARLRALLQSPELSCAQPPAPLSSEAVIYDDETKPAKGVENVTRLITRDKVFAIVGPVNSGVALAIIDIAQKNQIPLMDTIATAEQIIERYQKAQKNYIFRVSLNDGIQTSIMIDYINARKYQRIGLMHDSTGWGQSGRDTALRLLKEANLNLVAGPEVFDQNDSDMTAQLTKMKEAKCDESRSLARGEYYKRRSWGEYYSGDGGRHYENWY
jgi:branched-chain amino acid transport system substrate-binding protein